jgi:hypothetical protein
MKRLGITSVNAAQIRPPYDEHEAWGWFLKHPSASIRLAARQYLTHRRYGKPKQSLELSGTLNRAMTSLLKCNDGIKRVWNAQRAGRGLPQPPVPNLTNTPRGKIRG